MKKELITSAEKVKISINIPARLLLDMDNYRKETQQDRSSWITSAIMERIALIKKEKEIK